MVKNLVEETEVMKRMVLKFFGYDVQRVYVNEELVLGIAEYYEGNNIIEIVVMKERDNVTPRLTMFKSFQDIDLYFRVLEFEGRRYRIIIKIIKTKP